MHVYSFGMHVHSGLYILYIHRYYADIRCNRGLRWISLCYAKRFLHAFLMKSER